MAAVVLQRKPTSADVMAAATRLRAAKDQVKALVAQAEGSVLGEALIQIREAGIDPLEAVFAEGLRRFDESGEYAADGAIGRVAWLRWKCRLSAGAAAERLTVARHVDQLVEICRVGATSAKGSGARPLLVIRASIDTLAKTAGSPAGEIDNGGPIPAETVQRLACDSAISRIVGAGELQGEISRASRTVPASTRRAVGARDRHCVFPGCDRPMIWCDRHHLKFWTAGGPTTLENLALLCRPHHRKVHEGGWTPARSDGRFIARPPEHRSRSS
jgi:hypothetical protein